MQQLKEIIHHPAVRLAMSIANAEACRSGSEYIEPVHMLLAILNIIDDRHEENAESIGLRAEDCDLVHQASEACRTMLTISDSQITLVRRRLQNILTTLSEPGPIRKLEFSAESIYLINKAARQTYAGGSDELGLTAVFEEVLNHLPKEITPLLRA